MDIGELIKYNREKKGFSITDLAERIGISRSYLSRMEDGERNIKAETLAQIANVLDEPIENFYPDSHKRSFNINKKEVKVLNLDDEELSKFTEEEIMKFIKIGLKQVNKEK